MSVSFCVLRIEVDEDLPEMGDNPAERDAAKEQKRRDRGARESKTITVETYASILTGSDFDTGILPSSSRRSPPTSSTSEDMETISFFCGNPLVEVTKGILHLYKENEMREAEEAKTLCLLSIPGALGAPDLLAFAAACQQDIAHVRVLRDGSPDHYMALLTFRTSKAAAEFHKEFDGVPYSTLEPNAVCHMAWVSRVEWGRDGAPPPSHTELPICPVCLERMDESVAGVLSVQCAHAFHAECLARWDSARCPVCRCAQVPQPRAAPACPLCRPPHEETQTDTARDCDISDVGEGRQEAEAGSLWICLVCGHVGCGRYEGGHAAKHYLASNHTYALQIGSNRVWDYAGDNFVHRLVQNKPDGKLVEAGGGRGGGGGGGGGGGEWGEGEGGAAAAEKLESAQLEFTYTLTQQLDTQRAYHARRYTQMESEHAAERARLAARAELAEDSAARLAQQVDALTKENKTLERKLHQMNTKLSSLQAELGEERGLARALAENQAHWQARAHAQEKDFTAEIAELKEQLRDVMFFVEARGQLQSTSRATAEELASASVSLAPKEKPRRKKR